MRTKRLAIITTVMLLLLGTFFAPGAAMPVSADTAGGAMLTADADTAQSDSETVSFILTADMHSHTQPTLWTQNGETVSQGGFAAVYTVIEQIRAEYPDSVLLDGGDFSMGTSYQTIEQTKAPELMLMGQMGYDVITFGNHDFDYRAAGLAAMLTVASSGGQADKVASYYDNSGSLKTVTKPGWQMPAIAGTNIDWDASLADELLAEDAQTLQKAFDRYGVQDYVIIKRGATRIAVFGLMGCEAIEDSPMSGVVWKDPIDYARQIVGEIERNGEADMIVCLSHSGIYDASGDAEEREDIELAGAVPGIDLILSAHSHGSMQSPLTVGTTTIVSVGCYTQYVGHLVMECSENGCSVASFELIPVDGSVSPDETLQKAIDAYKSDINEVYFSKYGYQYDQVLAENGQAFTPIETFGKEQGEELLGDLIADSYVYTVQSLEGESGEPVDVAVVPYGVIRGSFGEGPITTADAYNVLSLGIGPDGLAGYPLVSVYLSGEELKTLADVDISVSPDMMPARLYFSGLAYSYNTHRMIFNRTTDFRLVPAPGLSAGKADAEIDDEQLYRVVGDLYTCQMLGLVSSGSKGVLSVKPKDKDGKNVLDFEDYILYDANGDELKAWYALANYIDSFEGDTVPAVYRSPQGRKVDETSLSPIRMLKQPNKFTATLLALIIVPIVLAALIVLLVLRKKQERRGYKRSMFGKANFRPNGGKPVFKGKKYNRRKFFKKKYR